MKKLLPLFIIVLTITVLSQNLVGQEKLKLPIKANDAQKISEGLLSSPLRKRKGEFETTAEYEKRRNNLAGTVLPDGSPADSVLSFVFAGEDSISLRGLTAKYDADTEEMSVSLNVSAFRDLLNERPGSTYGLAVAPNKLEDMGKYVGVNGYGTTMEVSKSRLSEYRLAINNSDDFSFDKKAYGAFKFPVLKMPPDIAKNTKPDFAVLYTGKLVQPFLGLDFIDIKPTITKPRELNAVTYYLYLNVTEIVLFNRKTGIVYSRITTNKP
jgi:hypothetical protein